MPTTYPNQKTVIIHRDMPKRDFIQIKKENFFETYRNINSSATILYLYLVGNKDGFNLALSPQAVENALGMPASTYRDQVKKLIASGYLVERGTGNIYDFYETPYNRIPLDETSQQSMEEIEELIKQF